MVYQYTETKWKFWIGETESAELIHLIVYNQQQIES